MQKALLISILIATMVIPLRASRIQERRKAIKKMDRQLFAFCALYVIGLVFLYPWLKVK
jgi:biotin transporter BioY